MNKIFPVFNSFEAMFTQDLSDKEKSNLTRSLRIILHSLDGSNGSK